MAKKYVLVGALSIVRFRAAIKEPEELVYLFLVISTGLGLGANQAKITILEFGDYQCTFCYKFHQDILPILKNEYINSGKI